MPDHNLYISFQAIYFRLHVISAYMSYVVFFIASVAAVLFLVQNDALKNKRRGVISSWLPDLSLLDKLNYRSIGLALPILTLSIFSGFLWASDIHGTYWWGYNSRQLYSILLWLIYAVILHVRLSAKMRGRKVAFLSIFAFLVIIFSLFGACH